MPAQFTVPNLLATCPFKDSTNPHYSEVAPQSHEWTKNSHTLQGKKLARFLQGNIELLASHTYPYADHERFRTCCDFLNLLFVLDETGDEQDGPGAYRTSQTFLSVMRQPDWDDGSPLANMTREFKRRLSTTGIRTSNYHRLSARCAEYLASMVKEAELRERGEIPDIATFEPLRRHGSAVPLCLALAEYALDIDLPDIVRQDETVMSLYWAAVDMVWWCNDVYSYNMEQALGIAGCNVVTVLMQEKNIDLQTASDLVGERYQELATYFVTTKNSLPSFGAAVDEMVTKYIMAMEHWVVGSLNWSLKTARYNGVEYAQVKQSLLVELLPRDVDGEGD